MTANDLILFERDIADCFNSKLIRSPIHLYSGNEDQMIEVFRDVRPEDWVCCSWRSHYQCLLKGVPPETVKTAILNGKSIALCFPEYRVISSAIAGGIVPIALGLAFSIRRRGQKNRVFCFMGDMTSEMGISYECMKYAFTFNLPIRFIVEDNGTATYTPTSQAWGTEARIAKTFPNVTYYQYTSEYPHSGAGIHVDF